MYSDGMTVSWNVINLSSVLTIYIKILRILLDIAKNMTWPNNVWLDFKFKGEMFLM